MLKDENKNRLYFRSDIFQALMEADERNIKEIKETIANKAHISTYAVKKLATRKECSK